MDHSDKIKETKRGLNARLLLLAAGVMLVINSVGSSGRTGLSWLNLADLVVEWQTNSAQSSVEENNKDVETTGEEFDIGLFTEEMDKAGLTTTDLRSFGIIYMISAVIELLAGLVCVLFSNRVDKSKINFTAAIILAIWELVFLAFLLLRGGLMLSVLFNSILLPLILLWSSWQLRKMAQTDPKRIFAVNPGGAPVRKEIAPKPKKTIKERANWVLQESEKDKEET